MQNKQKGFIGRIILILVALVFVASYFNFDIKSFIESPMTQKNISYFVTLGKTVWKGYLEKPTQYLWNSVFADIIKQSFIQTMTNVKALQEGRNGDIKVLPIIPQSLVPQLPQ